MNWLTSLPWAMLLSSPPTPVLPPKKGEQGRLRGGSGESREMEVAGRAAQILTQLGTFAEE